MFIHLHTDGHGLFLVFYYYKYSCYKYSCTGLDVDICFHVGGLLGHCNFICNQLRNFQTVFQSDYTILQSQQRTHFLISDILTNPYSFLFFGFYFVLFFDNSHPDGHDVVSFCGIDLHFPNN